MGKAVKKIMQFKATDMTLKPKKEPKVKFANVGVVVPTGYAEPAEPKEPTPAELDVRREAIRQGVRDIMTAAPKPLSYDKVYHQLRANGVDIKWLKHEVHFLISEVDEEINPDDFTE